MGEYKVLEPLWLSAEYSPDLSKPSAYGSEYFKHLTVAGLLQGNFITGLAVSYRIVILIVSVGIEGL